MTAAPATTNPASVLEEVVIKGDLAGLTAEQRIDYYRQVCESVGLNPYTRPFRYITLSGKLTLYATKDATEQLRKRDEISVKLVARDFHEAVGVYVVTAQASTPAGRTDEATGAVTVTRLTGEALANAFMKAETKAKRRVTLSICGLGMLDESEVDDLPPQRAQSQQAELPHGVAVDADGARQELLEHCKGDLDRFNRLWPSWAKSRGIEP